VVLDIKEYEAVLEDLDDITIVAERREEPTIYLETLKNRLKTEGLL